MQFGVFKRGAGKGVGLIEGDTLLDLSTVDPLFQADLRPLIESGVQLGERVAAARGKAERRSLETIDFALPILRPGKIMCVGLNYVGHAREGGHAIPDFPAIFMRSATSLVPAGSPMMSPTVSDRFDFEAELMMVIGRGGRHIKKAEALDHIFGYTLFNDGSIRDYQRKTSQWTPGKNFDRTGAVGPAVVTPDEVPEGGRGLRIRSRLNGMVMQDSNTADMIFPVEQVIEFLSQFTTLEPGDLIALGTPEGVGMARQPPVWMKPGDVIEIEGEGLGILRNPIVAEADATWSDR